MAPHAAILDELSRGFQSATLPRALSRAKDVFRSDDLDQTRAAISAVFSPHKLKPIGRSTRVDALLATWKIDSVKVAYLRHGTEVLVNPGCLGSYFVVNIPLRGTTVSRCGAVEAHSDPHSAIVLSPTHEVEMHWSGDCEQVSLRIERSAMETELKRMLGADLDAPLMFEVGMDLSSGGGRDWFSVVRVALAELHSPDPSLNHPLVRHRLAQLITAQLLSVHPHNYSRQLETGHLPARPPSVRRAIEIIEARAAEPLTVPALAQLVGTSVRSLQLGFRDHLGATPAEYLRQVRLARAREDLLRADPGDGDSVTDIAYRWGFAHLARFASYYKHRYGELPSQTLRTAGRGLPVTTHRSLARTG